jgi:hypothetical protein
LTITTLSTSARKIVTHTGTSGFTVTAKRDPDGVGLQVLMEFDQATLEEGVAMVGTLLTQLEEMYGESYVAACLGHYATDTGKKLMEAGDHHIVMVRGGKRGKPPRAVKR